MTTIVQKGLAPKRLGADHKECTQSVQAVQDALYVLNGKWKLPIIIGLSTGPKRFRELQRVVNGITAKVLSKELKELELNEFVVRNVYTTTPITVEYELTDYSQTLDSIIDALRNWGMQHRARILKKM
ncbi:MULTISPECIES: helix-turn-helix domain-containing protein [unclassified Spirosoma]|uniref:winged helix-turn-helix transcriptional regulator n=1 Tax=unclassified Spirosoma TaxID=2621999 RepID=UPI00095C3154|nr:MULTISPECIES: helix-turn-helix domain-containing protein [unclassified Spirosoma]MBN8820945.1 helix-turn-helix transcriptional regulator [Spirosoma sp.]OJW75956.1 MAG: transcriptional regulator [Spirosoma sp. 48-14]